MNVKPLYLSDNPDEEGLLEKHKDEVSNFLKKDNEIKKLILKIKKLSFYSIFLFFACINSS